MTDTTTRSGSACLRTVAMTIAVVTCWLNGLLIYWINVSFQLMGDTADRGEYLAAAGGCLASAGLLVLGLLALLAVGASRWLLWLTGGGVGTLLGIAWSAQRGSETAEESALAGFGDGLASAFLVPGSWPLLVLLVVAVVTLIRGRSSRSPR